MAPEARGKGVGTVATQLTLDYAFHVIGLEMVWPKVLEPNTDGRTTYTKAGFREMGTMRSSGVWKGRRCGEAVMDALPEDFPWPSVIVDADD
ncbi:GNAT family N-acetyltransferase [Nocardiopsis synnemataformans]|uniref:GNAT family N-acetyltransferase n=1 Tax=Nocardiopsis synnemataformans TaxID=61305 RepID=UPI003EBC165F